MSLENPSKKKKGGLRSAIDNMARAAAVAGTLLGNPAATVQEQFDTGSRVESVVDTVQKEPTTDDARMYLFGVAPDVRNYGVYGTLDHDTAFSGEMIAVQHVPQERANVLARMSPQEVADVATKILSKDSSQSRALARDLFANVDLYARDPRASEIAHRAFDIASTNQSDDPSRILYDTFDRYRDFDWAQEKYVSILDHLIDQDPSHASERAVATFADYAAAPHSDELLKKAVTNVDVAFLAAKLPKIESVLTAEQRSELQAKIPANLPFAIAALAHERGANHANFLRDAAFSNPDAIDRRLLAPLVSPHRMDAADWQNIKNVFTERNEDRDVISLKLQTLHMLSDRYGGVDPTQVETAAAMVLSNLRELGVDSPAASDVAYAVERIMRSREHVSRLDLFRGRDVVLISHDELLQDDSNPDYARPVPRFGTEVLAETLRARLRDDESPDASFQHMTPLVHDDRGYHSSLDSVESAKEDALNAISTSVQPLTVYFDGHGAPDALYLSSGTSPVITHFWGGAKPQTIGDLIDHMNDDEQITVGDLARALETRYRLHVASQPDAEYSNVILIFSACFMNDFSRALSDDLAKRGVPLPELIVSASQTGQYSTSIFTNTFGSPLNELLANSPSVGGIIRGEVKLFDEHPNIFVPMQSHPDKLMQISGRATAHSEAYA